MIDFYVKNRLKLEQMKLKRFAAVLSELHPNRLLKKGFSITMLDEKTIDAADEIHVGDEIITTTDKYEIKSLVTQISNKWKKTSHMKKLLKKEIK